jgi:hypothetical protein
VRQLVQPRVIWIKHVAHNKGCAEAVLILEQVIANVDKPGLYISPEQLTSAHTIMAKLSKDLSHAAPQV